MFVTHCLNSAIECRSVSIQPGQEPLRCVKLRNGSESVTLRTYFLQELDAETSIAAVNDLSAAQPLLLAVMPGCLNAWACPGGAPETCIDGPPMEAYLCGAAMAWNLDPPDLLKDKMNTCALSPECFPFLNAINDVDDPRCCSVAI